MSIGAHSVMGSSARTIYRLVDPRDPGVWHYIGQTRSLSRRLTMHVSDSRRRPSLPIHAWVRDLLAAGVRPSIEPIRTVSTTSSAIASMEEHEVINAALRDGHPLKNSRLTWRLKPE